MWRETLRGFRNVTGWMGANRRIFVIVAASVLILNIVLPPLVLSVVRKPYDHFSFNPWLRSLPTWLASDEATWGRKLEFVYNAALYWFIASSPYDAPEWGYSATVRDVLRWLVLSVLFGTYFALWYARRGQGVAWARGATASSGGRAGIIGVFMSTLGFSTLPCSVVGCGAPVLPVLGLTLTGLGLSVSTLESINLVSHTITWLVYLSLTMGIISLGRLVAARPGPGSTAGVR